MARTPDGTGGVIYAVVMVVFLVGLTVSVWLATRRTRRHKKWAAEHGWRVQDEDAALSAFVRALIGHQPAGRHRQLVHDVVVGRRDDRPAYSFTYTWDVPIDDLGTLARSYEAAWRTGSAHVVAVPLDRVVPMVQVTPEGVGSGLTTAVGRQDIQFESAAFNRAYRIVADDPRVAHAVLHPRLMEQLLSPSALGTSWRIEHGWVFAWAPGKARVDQILPMLDVVTAVRASLPTFVGTPLVPARPVA
jgi:hypothetical protein